MGLFGGGNSSNTQYDYTTNNDNRVGASDDGTVIQQESGASFSNAVTTTNVDARQDNRSTVSTLTDARQDNRVSINQTVDPGLLAAARDIAGDSSVTTRAAFSLADTALTTSAAGVKAAIQAASDANRHLSDTAALSIDAVSGSLDTALGSNNQLAGRAFDFSSAIAGKSIDTLATDNQRTMNFASDIFGQALTTITDSQQRTAQTADNFISDFSSQLATASESQSERNFGRIQQLAVVAVIVIVVGFAVAKG